MRGVRKGSDYQPISSQISKIQYKNIREFLRYRNFRVGVFFGSPCMGTAHMHTVPDVAIFSAICRIQKASD